MIEKYIKILSEVRADQALAQNFKYEEAVDGKMLSYDMNRQKRYQLLIALQFNLANSDKWLIEYLFEQEILMHEKAPFQGLYPSLDLCAYLLSRFEDVKHIFSFIRAKNANFDTHCGFDREYIVSAGIRNGFEYIDKANHELTKFFYECIGTSMNELTFAEEDLRSWRQDKSSYFPSILQDLSLEEEINLAIELGEMDIVSEKLTQWKSQQEEWTEHNLNQLSSYERQRGNLMGEIEVMEKMLFYKVDSWERSSHLQLLSSLYIQLHQYDKAWDKIKQAHSLLQTIKDWKLYGLGRHMIENCMDIVIGKNSSQDKISQEAYQWASKHVVGMKNLHLNLIKKTAHAAAQMNDEKLYKHFDMLHQNETKKLNEFLSKE